MVYGKESNPSACTVAFLCNGRGDAKGIDHCLKAGVDIDVRSYLHGVTPLYTANQVWSF